MIYGLSSGLGDYYGDHGISLMFCTPWNVLDPALLSVEGSRHNQRLAYCRHLQTTRLYLNQISTSYSTVAWRELVFGFDYFRRRNRLNWPRRNDRKGTDQSACVS